ncbi:MAG: response regulator [Deltaproteobacteria bacterium]|nr:response regulator [Deltaproteobacteria bacterium]
MDDDDSIRFLLKEELLADGHEVHTAADGPSALRAVEDGRPDVVVLDIKMPGMSGLEVLERLKRDDPRLPVFLLTAYADHRADASRYGADGYFVKSPNLGPLKAAVRQAAT